MQVFIMRHGDAALEASSDALRPLTVSGREESARMACWLKEQTAGIQQVLVSPYLRAKQTLNVVDSVFTLPQTAETLLELTPGGDASFVASYLQVLARRGIESVLLISHLPLVGYLVSELCPGESPPMFSTSAIAEIALDGQSGTGRMVGIQTPSHLLAKV